MLLASLERRGAIVLIICAIHVLRPALIKKYFKSDSSGNEACLILFLKVVPVKIWPLSNKTKGA